MRETEMHLEKAPLFRIILQVLYLATIFSTPFILFYIYHFGVKKVTLVVATEISIYILWHWADIQKLRFGPLEATLRAEIEEARVTIAQFKKLYIFTAKYLVSAITKQEAAIVFQGSAPRAYYTQVLDIISHLSDLGCNKAEIQDVRGPFDERVIIDLEIDLLHAVRESRPSKEHNDIIALFVRLRDGRNVVAPVALYRKYLEEYYAGLGQISLPGSVREALEDFRIFSEKKELRREREFLTPFRDSLDP